MKNPYYDSDEIFPIYKLKSRLFPLSQSIPYDMFNAGDDGLITYDLSSEDVVVSFSAISTITEKKNLWKV